MNIKINNKITRSLVFGAVMALSVQSVSAMGSKGRIALVFDGNSPDSDDISAASAALAILQAEGKEKKLVHCSHSCDLFRVPVNPTTKKPIKNPKSPPRITEKEEKARQKKMQTSLDDTAKAWGGFNHLTFWNCRTQESKAVDNLKKAINNSTKDNPLAIAEAGEPDIIYMALDKADSKKLKYVTIITHSKVNDNSGDCFKRKDIESDFKDVKWKDIPGQNDKLSGPVKQFDWAKKHKDKRIKVIGDQVQVVNDDGIHSIQNNKWDISDAGMVYFWATGKTKPVLNDFKNLVLDYVKDNPNGGGNNGGNNGGGNDSGDVVTILKRSNTNFCIDGGGLAKNGTNVRLFTFSDLGRQQWEEVARGNGFFSYIRKGTDHALDGGNAGKGGQNVKLWKASSTNQNQQWKKVKIGKTSFVRLQKRNSTGFSIGGGSKDADKQNVSLQKNSNTDKNQHWEVK